MHRDENRLRQLPAQFSVGLRGERRRVGDEQDDRLDQSLPGFVFEADLRHHFEELIEQTAAEIDDRCAPMVCEDAIEQRHLTARIRDIKRPNQCRKTAGEGGFARIKIITDQGRSTDPQELDQ